VLNGVNIPVTYYGSAPNANQLGGGTYLLEQVVSVSLIEAKYRDGFLWVAHSVRNPVNGTYSAFIM